MLRILKYGVLKILWKKFIEMFEVYGIHFYSFEMNRPDRHLDTQIVFDILTKGTHTFCWTCETLRKLDEMTI